MSCSSFFDLLPRSTGRPFELPKGATGAPFELIRGTSPGVAYILLFSRSFYFIFRTYLASGDEMLPYEVLCLEIETSYYTYRDCLLALELEIRAKTARDIYVFIILVI